MKQVIHVNQEQVSAALPNIPSAFEHQMQGLIGTLTSDRKEQPMKRRLSIGLALVLVLTLISVGALAAALLGGKDFVDQIMAPKAAQTDNEMYTSQEIAQILRIAEENGIQLPDSLLERLARSAEGYYKEELMRVFVKTEYGFYPSAWPIEVQHWYEEMLEACGQGDGYISNVLPADGELTQEQMLAIAIARIKESDPQADPTDESVYLRHVTYIETLINPTLTKREWYVYYQALNPAAAEYELTLSPAGEILIFQARAGIYGSSWEMGGQSISDRFAWAYGDGYGATLWNTERLMEFQKALRYRVEREGEESIWDGERHALFQEYLTPDATMVSAEAAVAAVMKDYPDRRLTPGYTPITVCLNTPEGPAWKVTLTLSRGEDDVSIERLFAEVDAVSGALKTGEIVHRDSDWRRYVSEAYWREHQPAQSASVPDLNFGPTPRPDGKPWLWYNDIAPDWYWEKLDAVNYNGDTANALMAGWYNTYGLDTAFWPLEAQAIDFLWHQLLDEGITSLPGLPGEGDISREEALALAQAAYEGEYGQMLSEKPLACGVSYYFNRPFEGRNVWQITFFDGETCQGMVQLDAQSGQIVAMEGPDYGGITYFDPPAPAPTLPPRSDGKPWMWENSYAPQEYWTALEAAMEDFQVTADNIQEKRQEWLDQYGDEMFWPHECTVMYQVLTLPGEEALTLDAVYFAMPCQAAVTQEQALEKAAAEFRRLWQAEGLTQEWADGQRPAAHLTATWETHQLEWVVQYNTVDAENPNVWINTNCFVHVDGQTGEITRSELSLDSNG